MRCLLRHSTVVPPVQVARLAGIPESVVAGAEKAGAQLEQRLEVTCSTACWQQVSPCVSQKCKYGPDSPDTDATHANCRASSAGRTGRRWRRTQRPS